MRNGRDSCLFGEELVSYIYDELPVAERHSFERHLLNCSSCTAEFAELSISRLGVYEWNRDEFVPLKTPQFAIPYARPEPRLSWLDAVRGFVFTPARLSFAGGALALLVVALGSYYVADTDSRGLAEVQLQQPIIEKIVPEKVAESAKAVDEVAGVKYTSDSDLGGNTTNLKNTDTTTIRRPAVVQPKAVRRPAERQLTARGNRPAKAPRLGTFDEVEDTSLRLSDLVADIDSYRK